MTLSLVTGGNGFVGSHLVERLVSEGCRVRCLLRRSSPRRWLPDSPLVQPVYGDLASGEGLQEAAEGVDTVFHVAGVTKANAPEDYYRGNVRGTEQLLKALGREVSLVHVSSLAAVGPSADGSPIREDAAPAPLTDYGRSKLEAERAVRASALCDTAAIIRPAVVYGPRDTDVLHLFRSAAKGIVVRIGRAPSFASIIHARDLAEVLVAAARCSAARGHTYFAANPQAVSWDEFGATAAELTGRRARSVAVPPAVAYCLAYFAELASRWRGTPGILSRQKVREGRCRFWVCDVSRARQELGFEARIPLREGMAETLEWYRSVGWLRR